MTINRRQQHLLRSLAMKRKAVADAFRMMRANLTPEKRAEMRTYLNEVRRARKGWANV